MFIYSVGKKNLGENVRGQARLIHEELRKLGSATSAQLTAAVAPNLVTRQDPARVVGYYLIVLGKKGMVARTIAADPIVTETETDTPTDDQIAAATTLAELANAAGGDISNVEAPKFVEGGADGEVEDDGMPVPTVSRKNRR